VLRKEGHDLDSTPGLGGPWLGRWQRERLGSCLCWPRCKTWAPSLLASSPLTRGMQPLWDLVDSTPLYANCLGLNPPCEVGTFRGGLMRAIRLLRISLRRNFRRVALAAGLSFSRRRRVLAAH